MTEPTYRCGFRIEHSESYIAGKPGAVRISRNGRSNIIGEDLFNDANAEDDDMFAGFMLGVLREDFPHPFGVGG